MDPHYKLQNRVIINEEGDRTSTTAAKVNLEAITREYLVILRFG